MINENPVQPSTAPDWVGSGLLDTIFSSDNQLTPPSVEQVQAEFDDTTLRLESVLGMGGMGIVYRGTETATGRVVAVKILPHERRAAGGELIQRFHREAEVMARLEHPNIARLYSHGETRSGLPFLVMEFVEGGDVAHLIARRGKLNASETLPIIQQVCEALEYAHQQGVVHRDIKPSNILLTTDGRVKVGDFGVARLENSNSSLGVTRSNQMMGSTDYLAPEMVTEGPRVDGRADIYAVGVMLYYMLTGQIPRGYFETPSHLFPELDPRLDLVVTRSLRNRREERYPTAKEMQQALEHLRTTPAPVVRTKAASRSYLRWGAWTTVAAVVLFGVFVMWNAREKPMPVQAVSSPRPGVPPPTELPALNLYESFDYPAGPLNGRNGGTGWDAPWRDEYVKNQTNKDFTISVLPTSLTYPGLPAKGGCASVPGRLLKCQRSLPKTRPASTVWFTWLARVVDPSKGPNDLAGLFFQDGKRSLFVVGEPFPGSVPTAVETTAVGITWIGSFQGFKVEHASETNASKALASSGVPSEQVNLHVLRVDYVDPTTRIVRLWVNPPLGKEPLPGTEQARISCQNQSWRITELRITSNSWNPGVQESLELDELTVKDVWNPE